MAKPLNIGMIGYGFMGRAHSNAYRKVWNFFDLEYQPVLKAACARDAAKIKAFADKWGYETTETDWRKIVERKDIDAVDICVPNDLHREMAIACAAAGKMILCEKPLARNAAEGAEMIAAVEKAKVPNMVWYNYRRVPAVTLAKKLIDEGRLGKIFGKPRASKIGNDSSSHLDSKSNAFRGKHGSPRQGRTGIRCGPWQRRIPSYLQHPIRESIMHV